MRYELISGMLFTLVAIAQITRALLGWPAQIDGIGVPIWVSVIAFLVTGSMAVWGFRSASRHSTVVGRD